MASDFDTRVAWDTVREADEYGSDFYDLRGPLKSALAEIDRLRAELATVLSERDRLRAENERLRTVRVSGRVDLPDDGNIAVNALAQTQGVMEECARLRVEVENLRAEKQLYLIAHDEAWKEIYKLRLETAECVCACHDKEGASCGL
jgi:regulator of replication initiation timing